jgi:hypothetical protein
MSQTFRLHKVLYSALNSTHAIYNACVKIDFARRLLSNLDGAVKKGGLGDGFDGFQIWLQ